jgi:PAS domain S-box-containing protein
VGLPPEAIEPHVRDRLKALRTRVAVRGEARFPTRLGERYFQYWINPVVDADGTVTATVTTATDVTERAEYERRIAHLNDIYATLSQTNETIVRIQDRDTLLQRICQIAVEHAHFRFAWIGLVDEEERRLKLVASAGEVVELLELADLPVNADDPRARGPTATAVREGRHQVCNDFQHADNTAPWHDVARRSRVGSSASFPIREQGRVVGALAVYAVEANYFDERLIRLLDEMATDIGFAFDNYHREALREQAERERRAAEQLFRGLVEQSIAGIYIVVDDRLEYVNPRFAEIHGYSPEEMAGLPVIETVAESGRAAFSDGWRRTRAAIEKSLLISYVARRKDGTTVHVGTHLNRAEHKGRTALIGVMQDISEKIRAEERIQEYIARLERAMLSTIRAISLMSELRDPYTYGHEQRVGDLAGAIAIEMGLGEEVAKGLRVAGYVHDIGKVVVPAEILAKPGRLTKAEFELIKAHPQQSYEILRPIEFPWPVALGALQHHERLDGSGYPNGAKGEEIALESRILAVADVVEAMSTHRPYRPAVGLEAALAEIGKQRGTRLDERAVDACVRLFREKGYQLPAVR